MSNVLLAAAAILSGSDRPLRVIEIGTGWGTDLHELRSPNLARLVSVDPMYGWVPDVQPEEPFDHAKVDREKVASWDSNSAALFGTECHLLIAKSWDAAAEPRFFPTLSGTDILIVDGCHHPASAVEADYWSYRPHLADSHTVLFDDLNHGDPGIAFASIKEKLEAAGELVGSSDEGGYVGRLDVRVRRTG